MKAVVVGVKGRVAAVLSDDGSIRKVKNNGYYVGQKLMPNEPVPYVNKVIPMLAAAAACIAIACGSGAYLYYTPYTYVSLDVNPSIEYSLNRFDRVLSVKGVNDDGDDMLEQMSLEALKNKPIEEAVTATVNQIKDNGYLDGGDELDDSIVIATSAPNKAHAGDLAERLQKSASQAVPERQLSVSTFTVEEQVLTQANELGVSPGKLTLISELQQKSPDSEPVDADEWIDKPVKVIIREIKQKEREQEEREQENESSKTLDSKVTDSVAADSQITDSSVIDSIQIDSGTLDSASLPNADSASETLDSAAAFAPVTDSTWHPVWEDPSKPVDSDKPLDSGDVLDSKPLDSNGNVLDSTLLDSNGNVLDSTLLDSNGNVLDSTVLDSNGNVLDSTALDSNGNVLDSTALDSNGNVLDSTVLDSGGNVLDSTLPDSKPEALDEEKPADSKSGQPAAGKETSSSSGKIQSVSAASSSESSEASKESKASSEDAKQSKASSEDAKQSKASSSESKHSSKAES